MKGDVYEDGTPNPLEIRCPICGSEHIVISTTSMPGIGNITNFKCSNCRYIWAKKATDGEDNSNE